MRSADFLNEFVKQAHFFTIGFTTAFNILLFAHGRQLFPSEITGQAMTAINLFMFAGIFLLQWFIGVIIGSFALGASGVYPPDAYSTVLVVTAVCNFVAVVVYYPRKNSMPTSK